MGDWGTEVRERRAGGLWREADHQSSKGQEMRRAKETMGLGSDHQSWYLPVAGIVRKKKRSKATSSTGQAYFRANLRGTPLALRPDQILLYSLRGLL